MHLPALQNVTFGGLGPRNVVNIVRTGLESVTWLKWPVSTSLNISSNAFLSSVSLPWDSVDGAVAITRNEELETVDLLAVKSIPGALTLDGNPRVKSLAFGTLYSVRGDVRLSGSLANVSMPMLKEITGKLAVESSDDIKVSCAEITKIDVHGKITCTSKVQTQSAPPTQSDTSGNPPRPSSTLVDHPDQPQHEENITTGAKIGIAIASVILGLFLVVGAVFFFRARSRGKVREIVISAPVLIAPPSSMSVASSTQSLKSIVSEGGSVGEVRSAEARAAGTRAGQVKVGLLGEELREIDGRGTGVNSVGGGMGRGASLRSVSSVGSEGPLVRHERSWFF